MWPMMPFRVFFNGTQQQQRGANFVTVSHIPEERRQATRACIWRDLIISKHKNSGHTFDELCRLLFDEPGGANKTALSLLENTNTHCWFSVGLVESVWREKWVCVCFCAGNWFRSFAHQTRRTAWRGLGPATRLLPVFQFRLPYCYKVSSPWQFVGWLLLLPFTLL